MYSLKITDDFREVGSGNAGWTRRYWIVDENDGLYVELVPGTITQDEMQKMVDLLNGTLYAGK